MTTTFSDNAFFLQQKKLNLSQLVFLSFLLLPCLAGANGKGPIGIWPATERYVLVADSSLPGIVLVDLTTGSATERLSMGNDNPTSITSCPDCDFAFVTGKSGSAWKLQFNGSIADLLNKTGHLGLQNVQLKPINLSYPGGSKHGKIDARIALVNDNGGNAYIASSTDHAVFYLDLSHKPSLRPLLKDSSVSPFGLNYDANGDILVTMHKKEVWRITAEGEKLSTYNTIEARCPGTEGFSPNLRAAIDDPSTDNSLIILASNPNSYDAVLWRLHYDSAGKPINCTILAGGIGRDTGWIDSLEGGEGVYFSRPHYFVLRPNQAQSHIIVSDIDNRALRLVRLSDGQTTTVPYDRDRRIPSLPEKEKKSTISCQEQHWREAISTVGPTGNKACILPPKTNNPHLSYGDAKSFCEAEGARLCEPLELRNTDVLANTATWTSAACASCWHSRAGLHCDAVIKTQRTTGTHKTKGFMQSWHSGQAIEIGSSPTQEAATFCSSNHEKHKTPVVCCADEL